MNIRKLLFISLNLPSKKTKSQKAQQDPLYFIELQKRRQRNFTPSFQKQDGLKKILKIQFFPSVHL